jgi:phage tail-like protein
MAPFGVSAALTAAASLLGIRNDPYLGFNYFVEIEGLIVGGFTEVTGLQIETEVQEYREGGLNDYVHKLPGATRYPSNLVLKCGLTDLDTFWAWHQDVIQGKVERKNGSIFLLDRQRVPATWWNFADAYPVKWTGPELRASSNAVAVETVELVHRGISKPRASGLLGAARGLLGAAANVAGKGSISF